MTLTRKLSAEFLGTAALVTANVASGTMAAGNTTDGGLILLSIAISTSMTLGLLILALGNISGAHFNPAVSLVMFARKAISAREFGGYVGVQLVGALLGVAVANLMYGADAFAVSTTVRHSTSLLLGEVVATMGLVGIILALVKTHRENLIPLGVPVWICAAILFTSSTSFANPAVTFGRVFTQNVTGIEPNSAIFYVVVQLLAGLLAWQLVDKLFDKE